jgi:hypothetical protein
MLKQPKLDIFDEDEELLIDSTYTKRVDVPVYVPSYKKPSVHELVNKVKCLNLIQRIKDANITEEEKHFLIYAAGRHAVFDFAKIADYYAHSSAELQELFEQSALVIVDFDKAIENGFVTLNNDLSNQYLDEQNG